MNDILEDERSYGLTDNHHLNLDFHHLMLIGTVMETNDIFMNFAGIPEIGSFSGLLLQERVNDSIKFRYDTNYKVFLKVMKCC